METLGNYFGTEIFLSSSLASQISIELALAMELNYKNKKDQPSYWLKSSKRRVGLNNWHVYKESKKPVTEALWHNWLLSAPFFVQDTVLR